jgi:hypothetical protein
MLGVEKNVRFVKQEKKKKLNGNSRSITKFKPIGFRKPQ